MIHMRQVSKYSSTLLQVLSLIKTEIKSQTNCNHLLQMSSIDFVNPDPETSSLSVSQTFLIFNSPDELHNVSIQVFPHRFSTTCSVVLFEIEQIRNSVNNLNAMSPYGVSHPAFQIFIDTQSHLDFQVFAAMTKNVPLAFLLVQTDSDLFNLYQSQPNHQAIKFVAKFNNYSTSTFTSRFTRTPPDYQGATLNVTTCVSCARAFETYKATGQWLTWSEAILWDLSVRINATIKFIPVPSAPRLEPVNEEWDDWVAPLTKGTGSIACLQPYSKSRVQTFYYADSVASDHVTFITRRPSRIYTAGFSRLLAPFSLLVWIGFFCSILLAFIAIELLIYFHKTLPHTHQFSVVSPRIVPAETKVPRQSNHLTTFGILVKPIIFQVSSHRQLDVKMRTNTTAKFLCALWLLVTFVIVSMYQSKMTSEIVKPEYSKPPEDFQDLADSNFQLNAVLWGGNIEADFQSANVSFSQKFIESVEEFQYSAPDCYVKIFEGDNACIAFHGTFRHLGVMFLLDIKGRILFLESKEARFSRTLTYAISKNNFDIKEPLDNVIRSVLASGVMESWAQNLFTLLKKAGIDHANKSKERLKIYASFDNDGSDSILPLLVSIGILGHILATCAFILENVTELSNRLAKYIVSLTSNKFIQ